jgi:hypothetical protein
MYHTPNTGETQRLYARTAEPEAEWQRSDPAQKQQTRFGMLLMVLAGLAFIWYAFHPGQSINSRGTPLESQPAPRITIIDNSSHVRAFCWCNDADTSGGQYTP